MINLKIARDIIFGEKKEPKVMLLKICIHFSFHFCIKFLKTELFKQCSESKLLIILHLIHTFIV